MKPSHLGLSREWQTLVIDTIIENDAPLFLPPCLSNVGNLWVTRINGINWKKKLEMR